MALLNRAKQLTPTTGTGTLVLGAIVPPYQSFGAAGAVDGATYSLLIEDGLAWELSQGTYSASAQTLARTLVASSTGSLLNLSGNAVVSCAAMAQDYHPYEAGPGQKIPQLADFTLTGYGPGGGLANAPNGILLTAGGAAGASGYNNAYCFKPAPASQSYSVCVRFKTLFSMHQYSTIALLFLNNSTGKVLDNSLSMRLNDSSSQWQAALLTDRWTNLGTYSSTLNSQTVTNDPLWFRTDLINNSNIAFYMSPDGYSWIPLGGLEPVSAWITSVTHVGFGLTGLGAAPAQYAVVSAFSTVLPQ